MYSLNNVFKLTVLSIGLHFSLSATTIEWVGTVRDFCTANAFSSCVAPPGEPAPINHHHFELPLAAVNDHGIVAPNLDASKKPTYNRPSPLTTITTPSQISPSFIWGGDLFDMWYRDTPGYNLTTSHTISLSNSIANPETYTNDGLDFFPIDNQLYGNQGHSHNYFFTFELHGTWQYSEGADQIFGVLGDDDIWFYINDKLAIDLGGLHAPQPGSFNADDNAVAFGFVDGETYDVDIYFAERHTTSSQFSLTFENLILIPSTSVPEPSTYLLLGTLLLGMSWVTYRKKSKG